MSQFTQAERLRTLPPYIFSELNALKAEAQRKGISLLSLAIGDPDKPTPVEIVRKLQEASSKPANHAYSPYEGTLAFRTAVKDWFKTRFSVELDPQKEILALIGSKEGLAHFPFAFCNPGDVGFYPSPGYPVFQTSLLIAGAKAIPLPLNADSGFLPDLNKLEESFLLHRPKYMILNFPSNPTAALCPRETLKEIVFLAKKYGVMIGYDNAYSEIYEQGTEKPVSILEIEGAKDIAIEFHSFSKTFNMTGWRIGFAVGNPELIAGLARVKTNIDSGPLLAVQETCAFALSQIDSFCDPIRREYDLRRHRLLAGLDKLGIEYFRPQATFFVWARVPQGGSSMAFTKDLLMTEGLVITPGVGFGQEGEGFFRFALTVDNPLIDEAMNRLERFLKR